MVKNMVNVQTFYMIPFPRQANIKLIISFINTGQEKKEEGDHQYIHTFCFNRTYTVLIKYILPFKSLGLVRCF